MWESDHQCSLPRQRIHPYSPSASHDEYRHGISSAISDTLFWRLLLPRLTLTYNLAQLVHPEWCYPDLGRGVHSHSVGRHGTAATASEAGTIASGGPLRSPINLSEFPEVLAAVRSLRAAVSSRAAVVLCAAAAGLRAGRSTLAGDLPAVRLLRRGGSSLWGFVR